MVIDREDCSKLKTFKRVVSEADQWIYDNSIILIDTQRWYAGITNDIARRKSEHKRKFGRDPKHWRHWNVRTVKIARSLEIYFADQGFCNFPTQGGVNLDSRFFYVFKAYPTIWE